MAAAGPSSGKALELGFFHTDGVYWLMNFNGIVK